MTKAFLRISWWQQIMIIAAVSICYILLAGTIGTKVLLPRIGWGIGNSIEEGLATDSMAGRFARWDAGHYLQIAQNGYSSGGTELAFFPLYPMAMRFISEVSGLPFIWSGFLISIVCLVVACLFLYQWILIDYQHEVAIWSVMWLCFFPMAFFFISIYAEALFLLLCVASIYFARRGWFIASGIAIALAGATRPSAFLLAIPFFVEFWQQGNFERMKLIRMGIGALIAPLGVLSFSLFLSQNNGNKNVLDLYAATQAAEWHRYVTWPWRTFYDAVNAALFGKGINPDWFSRVIAWQDLTYALLGIVISIYSLFRLRLSIALFVLLSMLFFYTNHGPFGYAFWSIPRYMASLFPIYLILALVTNKLPSYLRWGLLLASMGLLGLLTAWFTSGRWVA